MAETAREMSLEAYLELDATSEVRHEYLNGLVVAMAGASPRHDVVTLNRARLLGNALLDGPCTVFDSVPTGPHLRDERLRLPRPRPDV